MDILIWEKGTLPSADYMYLLPLLGGIVTCIVVPLFTVIIQESISRYKQKQKSPFRWLILIPVQLLSLVCMFPLGMFLDQMIYSANGQIFEMHNAYEKARGYQLPPLYMPRGLDYLVFLLPKVGVVITGIVTIVAIVLTIISLVNRWNKKVYTEERMPKKER